MNTTTALCPATHPTDGAPCWYPVGHHGRDLTNDWDRHQDATGRQWADPAVPSAPEA